MIRIKGKDDSGSRLFESKSGDKLSKHGREAKEELRIDRTGPDKTTKDHVVRELRDDGTWEMVHDEHQEFRAKRRPKK